jgi:hypothetical protein
MEVLGCGVEVGILAEIRGAGLSSVDKFNGVVPDKVDLDGVF